MRGQGQQRTSVGVELISVVQRLFERLRLKLSGGNVRGALLNSQATAPVDREGMCSIQA